MNRPKFSEIYKLVIIAVLTAIMGFVLSDIELLGSPQKYYIVLYLGGSLLLSIAIVQSAWVGIPKVMFAIVSYFKDPHFKNVKVSFDDTKVGEISIHIQNKEWRYPEIRVYAMAGLPQTKPEPQHTYWGDLVWEETGTPDETSIEKNDSKYLVFLKTDKTVDEFYIELWRTTHPRFPRGTHEIRVTLYITIGRQRIARTIAVFVDYQGGDSIDISKLVLLTDISQK